jgi:hypothetical protein
MKEMSVKTQRTRLSVECLVHFSRPRHVPVEEARRSQAQRSDLDTLLYDMNAYAEENRRFPLDVEMVFADGGGI